MSKNRKFLKALSVVTAVCVAFTMGISASAQPGGKGKPSGGAAYGHKSEAAERENGFTTKTVAAAYLMEKGIIRGNANGEFTMSSKIKRGDFIIMLVRAFKLSAKIKNGFKDVLKYCYYYDAVSIAQSLKIALGDGHGRFRPENNVTVQEAMLLIERAAAVADKSVKVAPNTNLKTAFATLTLTSYATKEQIAEMLYYVLTGKTDGATIAPKGTSGGNQGGSATATTGKYTLNGGSDTLNGGTLTVTDANVSAIKVNNGGNLTLSGYTIAKSGNTASVENSATYGLNAAVLAESAGNITLTGASVTTDAKGADALFATGANSKITAKNASVSTAAESSRGLAAVNSGNVVADVANIATAGSKSAAAAAGAGGTLSVSNSTLKTNGADSPVLYSAGNLLASASSGTAFASEAAVVEGKSGMTLLNTVLSAAKKYGVLLYQSTSGDPAASNSSFSMTGGSLTAAEGPLFYVTNTTASLTLSGATLSSASGTLLKASADNWGKAGANGGIAALTANAQNLPGNILCDDKSTVSVTLNNSSILTGAVNSAKTAGKVSLTLDATSKWVVTGNSYLSAFTDANATLSNIDDNGFTITYDPNNAANSWLKGATYALPDGGKLQPNVG